MSLNTKNIAEGKISKTLKPGYTLGKIYGISLAPGYNEGSYQLVLNIESAPVGGDFEGFFKDKDNESLGRFEGQIGRVKYSRWAFEDKVLPGNIQINRDQNILKAFNAIAKALGIKDQLDEVDANTIEEYVAKASPIIVGANKFISFCLAGKEYTDKNGYLNYELFLPKANGKKYALSADEDTVITFNVKDHIIPDPKAAKTVSDFEPDTSNTEFDVF